jgi:hypothetical protein
LTVLPKNHNVYTINGHILSLYYVFYHEAHEEKLFFNSDLRALRDLRGEIFFAILTDSKSAICDRVE